MADHVLTDTTFDNFELHPLLQKGLADCGFTRCTPIQALTLPVALAGNDVAGQAQTGTGKTCAFLVTVMNHLLTKPARAARKDTDPRALVIAPTRELAIQIDKDARALGVHTGLQTALIYGGVDYDKQRQMLKDGCDIVIATPGRMLDYHKQHIFSLDNVEIMVIDEADRMFDLGFIKDVRYIFRRLPPRDERQVLLYSATLSHRVLELAYEHMHEAEKLVAETDNITADKVRQVVYFPAREEKLPLLLNLLKQAQPERAIVFVNTRMQTDRVRDNLRRHGYRVGALSGDVPQDKRQKVLKRFKDGQIDMLVCTDVAARGLHIPHVSHVFNYDLPQDAEDYVHRIGRTARLGAEGDAISFACDRYAISLPDIETYIEQKIPVGSIAPDMLVMPAPPKHVADVAADDDDVGETAKPAQAPRKPRAQRDGSRSRHGGRASGRTGTASAAAGEPSTHKVPADQQDKPAEAGAAGPTADASPKRRRRRGGRNRHRQSGPSQDVAATQNTSTPRSEAASQGQTRGRNDQRQGHRGNRNRGGHAYNDAVHRPAPQASAPAPAPARGKTTQVHARSVGQPQKAGFLKRLAKGLFGGRK